MKILFSVVGAVERPHFPAMHMDAVPRLGETIDLPGLEQYQTIVRTVVWYPLGDEDDPTQTPFVYVVVGPARPGGGG